MYSVIKKILFCLDPETSHNISLKSIRWAGKIKLLTLFNRSIKKNPVKVMGLAFENPVGLAAGLDKNGDYFNGLGQLGFGFVEIGTVTPLPQSGNPKQRLFRLQNEEAIINRMGFNNYGVRHLVKNAKARNYKGVLGINIGKNKVTSEENALLDYQICMDAVYAYADYIAINVSSPNTPGLRNLQFGESFRELLSGIKTKQAELQARHNKYVPVVVKIAPDMSPEELKSVAECLLEFNIDGVIATNTTVSREGIENSEHKDETGGLSGAPVKDKSTETIRALNEHLNKKIPIIGVGGIMNGEDALDKILAGASLVQIYSGFIYAGPDLIADSCRAIKSYQDSNNDRS